MSKISVDNFVDSLSKRVDQGLKTSVYLKCLKIKHLKNPLKTTIYYFFSGVDPDLLVYTAF